MHVSRKGVLHRVVVLVGIVTEVIIITAVAVAAVIMAIIMAIVIATIITITIMDEEEAVACVKINLAHPNCCLLMIKCDAKSKPS